MIAPETQDRALALSSRRKIQDGKANAECFPLSLSLSRLADLRYPLAFSCNRAIVLHSAMNVTLKLPDDLCREARHRAVDESKSLSAWITDLMVARLRPEGPGAISLLEALGDETVADGDLKLPDRRDQPEREIDFP